MAQDGWSGARALAHGSDLTIEPPAATAASRVAVRFRIKNTGARAGDEVAQLYVRDALASVARPVMELKGFTRVGLQPGEEREIVLSLDASDLRMLDANMRWVVEPGVFRIMVGASSEDIRLRGELTIANPAP